MVFSALIAATVLHQKSVSADLAYLRTVSAEVIAASKVSAKGEIKGGPKNETGFDLRVPGGTQNYYPAFWIRDAAMMLGGDFVPASEIEGWIRLIAKVQARSKDIPFPHGMIVPPYSIPDHITLHGEACWYPGAYAEQGDGHYGLLPPADDAFFYIGMIYEQGRAAKSTDFLRALLKDMTVAESAREAFNSVEVDKATGLVKCDPVRTRVDWGFCDSIRKTGLCLMPSLLRYRAALQMLAISIALDDSPRADWYATQIRLLKGSIVAKFLESPSEDEALLWSATEVGRQEDIWAASFALTLGVFPAETENRIARRMLRLYKEGKITAEGQVRHLVTGTYWEQATSTKDTYQNGGFWGTATGWLAVALSKVDRGSAERLVHEYVMHIRARRAEGAPFEWINPATKQYVNGNYASSAGLVYVTLKQAGWK